MYETHWQLDCKPFEHTLDHRFYYPGETHQGALLKLRYAIESRRGAALLSGPSGVGKSLLVAMLRKQLGERHTPFVHLVFPQMPVAELLSYLAAELGTEQTLGQRLTIDCAVHRIQEALAAHFAAGRHPIVVVDEAHLVHDVRAFEALRLLLNFENDAQPGLSLLLVGQPNLLPTVDRMSGLEERLAVKSLLRPLALEETVSYVSHRLKAAGARNTIFEPSCFETMQQLTHGVIRRINRLCDLALLIGYAEERRQIGAEQLETICDELVNVSPE